MKLARKLSATHDGKRVARTPKERRLAFKLARQSDPLLRLRRGVFLYVDGTQPLYTRLVTMTLRAYSSKILESVTLRNPLFDRMKKSA